MRGAALACRVGNEALGGCGSDRLIRCDGADGRATLPASSDRGILMPEDAAVPGLSWRLRGSAREARRAERSRAADRSIVERDRWAAIASDDAPARRDEVEAARCTVRSTAAC
jgi:hypothetical protein